MDSTLKAHLTHRQTWLRGLFIVLFSIIYSTAGMVLTAIVVFQFISILLSGACNPRLLAFARQLSTYLYQVLLYVTFNREERPWPFDAWPTAELAALTDGQRQQQY
ncbi:DUF4389 domain-containing protein [Nitrococcus mobilis]|uniref:Possible lipase n=1 Tax=Nitrococcus mobilis Nb-231 TaxID=314278 RepID=A4BPA8_9GAMM|nr:DUF4389 domain-containing protein [Nitrococcus mobilis]EAR22409.1 possible lipase [Nitrococcus mobilis Nb-231]